jgi:hypothetical protein
VLPFATGIGETEVNKLDFVLFHHLHHVCDGLGHQILLNRKGLKSLLTSLAVSVPTRHQPRHRTTHDCALSSTEWALPLDKKESGVTMTQNGKPHG